MEASDDWDEWKGNVPPPILSGGYTIGESTQIPTWVPTYQTGYRFHASTVRVDTLLMSISAQSQFPNVEVPKRATKLPTSAACGGGCTVPIHSEAHRLGLPDRGRFRHPTAILVGTYLGSGVHG
jgi:hypothetical protein